MESIRQSKVARLLQKDLGQYFQLEGSPLGHGGMITVTIVRVSPDLGSAKIYLSIFPSEKAEKAMEEIQDATKSIRYQLGKKVRHQLRVVPELHFFLDDSLDYADKIDDLLK
ncbi:MAG: 30S ribosome-binding factor RbfA [Bacteroidales bacterium]|nr:30S ribosome-binding factor RbfA [Bacteroidales bacterium]MCF8456878.1 30S ribosome-binding factor RbfA [Bacteroidales bacterium]